MLLCTVTMGRDSYMQHTVTIDRTDKNQFLSENTCSSVNMRGSKLSSIVATEMSFCRISKRFKYTPVFLLFPLSHTHTHTHTHTHMHTLGVMCLIHSVRELCLYAAMIHVSLKSNRLVNQTAQTEGWQAPPTFFFFPLFTFFSFSPPHTTTPTPFLPSLPCRVLLRMRRGSRVAIYWCLSLWPAV